MSKVMSELFMGSKLEEEIAQSNDPDYILWSEQLEEQLNEQFGTVEQSRKDRPEAHKESNIRARIHSD